MLRRYVPLVSALALLAACQPRHGPPRVKRLPKRDDTPALRGGTVAPRSSRIASYKIDARLDGARHSLTATQTLVWTNAGASPVTELPFHLYLNAFKNEQSLFMRSSQGELRGDRAIDTGWGWISIESLTIGGAELAGKLTYPHAPDETVAVVQLPQPLQPGSTLEVQLKFSAQLPEVFARTGYKGDFHLVGQWFPKVGVRLGPPGAEYWECRPHHAFTEFFADFGTYDVSLTVPATHVVAATGVLQNATEAPGQTRTFVYHAEDVHDFVWMADPYMVVDPKTGRTPFTAKAKVEDGEVEVRVYARKEQTEFAKRHLKAAVGAVERFSEHFMPYPWPILTVIDPPVDATGAAGMEYPTLVTTGGDSVFARPGIRLPEFVTVHEIGHQWFQGILASNEPEEAWLDEGVNEWADAVVMRDLYGPRASGGDWLDWQADVSALRRVISTDLGDLPAPIATAGYAFPDFEAYAAATYVSTARALDTLEAHVGSTKFMAAMKAYVKEFAFTHPTGRDFFTLLERELGTDLGWFVGPVFQQIGGNKLAVRSSECRNAHPARGVFGDGASRVPRTETEAPDAGTYVCEVVIENTGVIHVPVDVDLEFEDGSRERMHWDDRGHAGWHRFVVERSSRLVGVNIDPERRIALANPILHHVRSQGDGAASLRAAARISSWGQFLMQLVGP